MKPSAPILTVLLCLLALPAAGSYAADTSGLYFGANFGRSQLGYDTSAYTRVITGEASGSGALDLTNWSLQKRAGAWSTEVGYMHWHYVGIEAAYLHLGELNYRVWGKYTPTLATAESIAATTSVLSRGPALSLVMRVPVAEGFDVNLRLGDYYARTTLENGLYVSGHGYTTTRASASGSSLLYGAGASYTFDGHWSARLDYLRVSNAGDSATTGHYNADLATVGFSYTF